MKKYKLGYLSEMKHKFNEDNFIEIDKKNIDSESKNFDNISDIAKRMDIKNQNQELKAEFLRRKRFNLYWRLKMIRVNASIPKILFSSSQKKFIDHVHNENNWQLKVFGLSQPYIVKSINSNQKDHLPEVANGYLGINGFSDEVQMQSLFSGSHMATHRAAIPSWTVRNITAIYDLHGHNLVIGRRMELDMSNGRLIHVLLADNCLVEQQIYAHQTLKSLIVHEIQVQFLNSNIDVIVLKLPKDRKRDISGNIEITDESVDSKYIKIISGVTHANDMKEHEQHIHAYYHVVEDEIRIRKSENVMKYYYLLSINEDKEISRQHFEEGVKLIEDNNKLFENHEIVWRNIWSNNGVFMRRSNLMDIPLISAQYLINSNLPNIGRLDTYGAMGATGLGVISNQGAGHSLETNCGGRIEYTQELWMLNSQILLHPESVKSIINKRILQMPMAKSIAQYFDYKGAKYPAVTNELGEDLCTNHPNCGNMQFPSGLIAMTLNKYLFATGDQSMFTNKTGLGLLIEINYFWKSIHEKYELDKTLESVPVSNVNLNVQHSVFNFGLMKEGFLIIPALINFFNITPDHNFVNYVLELHNLSNKIVIPFDRINNYHPPYDGFDIINGKLYLPEGVMLRYPLDHIVDIDSSIRNLQIYEKRLFQPVSPMSLSVLFINNMDADRFVSASKNFEDLTSFSDNLFKIWTNNSKIWKGSYIPAASGYLDSILFGFLGIRIRRSGLYVYPKLLSDISFIEVSSLEYLGSTIKIIVDKQNGIILQLISSKPNAYPLGVMDINKNERNFFKNHLTYPLGTYFVIRRLKYKSSA